MGVVSILFIGDVVGRPGRWMIQRGLPPLRAKHGLDFVIANGENLAGGSGVTAETVAEMFAAGVQCVTTGDHAFKQREGEAVLKADARVLRPVNLSERAAGRGMGLYETAGGVPIAVINVQGRTFMPPIDNPFRAIEAALERIMPAARVVVVDVHAEATSDKIALGWLLDGRVTAVLGTHTHVPTADERVLPGGTAYISDVGMTGPHESVLGRRTDRVLAGYLTDMPQRLEVATGDNRLNGVVVRADPATGRALGIERVCLREADLPPEDQAPQGAEGAAAPGGPDAP